jgi:hypothetical protein
MLIIVMSEDIKNIIEWLMYEEQSIFAVAIIGSDGNLVQQTDNWDVTPNLNELNALIRDNPAGGQDEYYGGVKKGITSITLSEVKYMIVENTSERKIGTNIQGQGSLICCPVPPGGTAGLVCYISAEVGPRDALAPVQNYAAKLVGLV